MEIRVLNYFLAVVRAETITKAAEDLHITQPTLSRQLKQLEDQLGVTLFQRGSRKIKLTSEGELLYRRGSEIVELANKTHRELTEQEGALEGVVSIGSGEFAAAQLLPELLASFSAKHPLVSYDLYTGTADTVRQRMDQGLTDIGLLLEPVNIQNFDYIRLKTQEQWVILMTPDHPLAQKAAISPENLVGIPLIMVSREVIRDELASWFGDYFSELTINYKSNLSTNAAVLVRHNLGCAITIAGSLPYLDQKELTTRPLTPSLKTTSLLAWKRDQPFSRATTQFIAHTKSFLSMTADQT